MAAIAQNLLVLKNVSIDIDGNEYGGAGVSSVAFTPSSSAITYVGFNGVNLTDVTTATWQVAITFSQDWETANSLSRLLFENEGETVEMTFEPKAGGPAFTADVVLTPGAIGGGVNTVGEATVTLGCSKPVYVPAA